MFIRKLPPTTTMLIDEAYHHYFGGSAGYASFLDRPIEAPRLIVTRTFSHIQAWPDFVSATPLPTVKPPPCLVLADCPRMSAP